MLRGGGLAWRRIAKARLLVKQATRHGIPPKLHNCTQSCPRRLHEATWAAAHPREAGGDGGGAVRRRRRRRACRPDAASVRSRSQRRFGISRRSISHINDIKGKSRKG